MITHFKRLSKQTLIYGLGDVIIKAIAFLLIPLYTHRLQPNEYGELSLLQAIEVALPIILSLGFNSAILKVYHDYEDIKEQKIVFSTAVIFVFLTALPILLLLFFNAGHLARLIGFSSPERFTVYLRLILSAVFFNLFRLLSLSIMRAYERGVMFSVINIIHFTMLVSLNIYFVAYKNLKIEGIVWSSFITAVIIFLVVFITIISRMRLKFSKSQLKALFHFGLPLVPGGLASWTLTLADRYLLKFLANTYEVGLYDIGYKFGMIVNMLLVHPFRTAWLPFIFSIQKDPNAKKIYSTTFTYFMLLGCFLCMSISVMAKEIVTLTSAPDYLPGFQAIPLIAVSYLFYGIYYTVDVGVLIKGKTGIYAIVTWIGAGLDIALAYLMIPHYGMLGAGIAKVISFFLLAVIMYIFTQVYYPIKYELGRVIYMFLLATGLFGLSYLIATPHLWLNILLKMLLLLLFPIILLLTRFFTPREQEVALNFLKSRLKLKKKD